MGKARFIRSGDELPDDETVVRGGELEAEVLGASARRKLIYGVYAVSVLAVRGFRLDELAQEAPLVRFSMLTLISAGAIRRAGLRLEPTGRNPRHYAIVFDDLETGIRRLLACDRRVWANPYDEETRR